MTQQQGLYKTPRDPGYLGGYRWKPTTLGFVLLLMFNAVATQFVAYRFHYQRGVRPQGWIPIKASSLELNV